MVAAGRAWFSTSKVYAIGVLLLFILGIAGEVSAAHHVSFWGVSEELVSGLGEAFLVSGILAVLVDPLMKRRMQDDSAWGAIFGYLNPAAPEGLRKAVREIVKPRSYVKQCRWEAKFEWHESRKVLAIELGISAALVNLDPKKRYKITGPRWVLGSIPGHETKYLEFTMTCPAGDFGQLSKRGDELDSYVEKRDDGTLLLDVGELAKGCTIPPSASWSDTRKAVMYRSSSGYVPLHTRSYAEDLTVTVSGTALRDLRVYVTAPSREPYGPLKLRENGKTQSFEVRLQENVPGQLILLSWSLRGDESSDEDSGDSSSD
ncbi:hypothetical protein [Streptomyces sp. NPDC058476]|uniref:hypothetical protein n=1 Tax=Streptomyces sp. NPDC058476 TaxID=3346519 RepID=UPI00365E5814